MKQKLAIACGLLHSPQVIFFDEPLTGLDPIGIRRMKDSILKRARAGAAILISSHLLHLLEEVCSHVLILKDGRKMIDGSLEEVRQRFSEQAGGGNLEDAFFRATGETKGEAMIAGALFIYQYHSLAQPAAGAHPAVAATQVSVRARLWAGFTFTSICSAAFGRAARAPGAALADPCRHMNDLRVKPSARCVSWSWCCWPGFCPTRARPWRFAKRRSPFYSRRPSAGGRSSISSCSSPRPPSRSAHCS